MNTELPDPQRKGASVARWKFSRHFILERWRLSTRFRVYHGLGMPKFEFALVIGRKRV